MPLSAFAAPLVATHAEYLHLTYRPDLQTVILRWLRDVSLSELQLAHRAALELTLHHKAAFWFVDVRRRLVVNNTHTRWLADEFLPHAAALTPTGNLRIAYLTSPSRQRIIDADSDMQLIVTRAESKGQPYRLRTFLDEASAMAWLLEG
ncbi:hypothetical protein [Hymenobacter volaticus]|uniref:STAS/SEC14 domain-containing protein n=1 Tax=Hymenobacter volaticus TaxID=2932254 RepID=A0ABY4G4A3_9BACT|nr:hypothetical protein [Hymenobacter volaticus]UOQ65615.1 hypothetical protein MUN86_19055 [Hymenobacter volaticus]